MIVLSPKYSKHSMHLGVQIFKRKLGTGTSGGMWLAASTTFKSLANVKAHLDYLQSIDCLPVSAK
jgi:hypothetical protein